MQPPPSSVAPAIMGPPASKSSSVRNDKFFPTRGRIPSEKSSTSSSSKRDTCFVCTNSSAYDLTKLINCSACKRRFHRGCHKPPVAQNSPSDWTCFMCALPKDMQPAVKKRKLGRSVFAPATGDKSRMSLDGKEIPESPQEQLNTANETSSKPNTSAQPPRFAPFTTDAEKRRSIDSFRSNRQIQPPRFAPSALEAKGQSTVKSTVSNLKGESTKVGKHSFRIPDASVIISQEASRISTPTPARSNIRAKKPSYYEVIGMALHEAPDCCLSSEGIQRWVVDNLPSFDSKDPSWERGVWATLSHSDDFVYLKDKAKTGLWTFRDGSSNQYRKWQKRVNKMSSASSAQDVTEIQERTKQGDEALGRNAEGLSPDHELEDLRSPDTQSDQIASKENTRARSNTNSAVPSTVDETLEMVDLTMDDDEPLPSRLNPLDLERSMAEDTGISLLQAPERISSASPKDRRSLKRSRSVAFGKPVWGSRTSVPPELKRSTPFTDSIVKKASEDMKENIRRGGKWKAAVEKMGASVKSPMKANIDLVRKSLTKSPIKSPKPTSSVSQPLASPRTQDAQLNSDSPKLSDGLQLLGSGTGMQNDVLLHPCPSPLDIARGPTIATDLPAESDAETADQVVHVDLDLAEAPHEPNLIEPEPGVPSPKPWVSAETESNEVAQGGARQEPLPEEPLPEEPLSHEPLAEEPLAEEPPAEKLLAEKPLAEESPISKLLLDELPQRTYADSAAQTSPSVTSAFTLGKITQISLEPRVPAAVAPAISRATANFTTQTRSPPEPQTAPRILSSAPTVQLPTPQAEPIESQPPQENGHDPEADFEKDCLDLLDEMMYPTKTNTPDWPSHCTSLPDPFTTPSVPLSTIRARSTRKQIFGKNELSRIENNNALTKLNKIKLGTQNVGQIELGKGYTEEERRREIEINEKDGHYDTLEELFNMPQQVVPFIHEQQLAFRDYAPNALGRIGRPRVTYKIGANAR